MVELLTCGPEVPQPDVGARLTHLHEQVGRFDVAVHHGARRTVGLDLQRSHAAGEGRRDPHPLEHRLASHRLVRTDRHPRHDDGPTAVHPSLLHDRYDHLSKVGMCGQQVGDQVRLAGEPMIIDRTVRTCQMSLLHRVRNIQLVDRLNHHPCAATSARGGLNVIDASAVVTVQPHGIGLASCVSRAMTNLWTPPP